MTIATRSLLNLTIVAVDPPFTVDDGVLFGLQSKRDVDDPRPACETTEFQTTIDIIRNTDAEVDFAGEHVHGRRGDRFVYLAWGLPDPTEPFIMFARAKIKLDHIPTDLLERSSGSGEQLMVELQATNPNGHPASGTIKPPSVVWHAR